MQINFANPELLVQEYLHNLHIDAVVAGLIFVIVTLAIYRRVHRFRPMLPLFGAVGFYYFFAWTGYSESAKNFVSLDVDEHRITLYYVYPGARTSVLPRETIDTVLFASKGRHTIGCHVTVVLKDGTRHMSASMRFRDDCQEERRSILRELGKY